MLKGVTTMANEMRDRLYNLLGECEKKYSAYYEEFIKQLDKAETQADFEKIYDGIIKKHDFFADHLIENGVVVPPVKLGSKQKVYIPVGRTTSIFDTKVYGIGVDDEGDLVINPKKYPEDVICINGYNLGETAFLTKSEAEQKLKEMRGENDA
jgi:hypothetical protein